MLVNTANQRPQRRRFQPVFVVLASVFVALVVVSEFFHPIKNIGHDDWRLLPIQEWGLAVGSNAGFWDGIDLKTHHDTGGRIYTYGFLERSTNTQ